MMEVRCDECGKRIEGNFVVSSEGMMYSRSRTQRQQVAANVKVLCFHCDGILNHDVGYN